MTLLILLTLLTTDLKNDVPPAHALSCELQRAIEATGEAPGTWTKMYTTVEAAISDQGLSNDQAESVWTVIENWDTTKCD